MLKKLLMLVVLVHNGFLIEYLSAQQIPDKPLDIYWRYTTGIPDEKNPDKREKKVNTPWFVFSDRNNNYTYKKPDGSVQEKTLDFLEEFYVVEERDGWLRIVKVKAPLESGKFAKTPVQRQLFLPLSVN